MSDEIPPHAQPLVEAVFQHAKENYVRQGWNTSGWDTIYDTWTPEDVYAVIWRCRTAAGAIQKMEFHAEAYWKLNRVIPW